jgi:phage-related protein
MANSFGGSIKLTGENEYRKALSSITGDLRLMASEMKVLQSATDSSGKATDADKAKRAELAKQIETQRAKLNELNDAYRKEVSESGASSDASKKLQTQINNATAQLNKMETSLNSAGDETGELGKEMDDTGKKASIFGDVLKANLASEAIVAGIKKIGEGIKALGSGLVSMVKDSVAAFADYEQLTGGVETLFKDSADTVIKNAEQAYKTAGMSANQYMETVTGFSASLLQGLGGDTAEAAKIGNMAVLDMSDNANKMGTDVSMIQNAYQGFAKQNYTMLDNLKLGYGGTKTEMERLLKDAEKMPEAMGQKFDLNNYADVVKAINVVQKNMGITGTTAKEASETITGSMNATKAAWENVLTSFASGSNEQIKEAIDGMVESFTNLATNIVEILPNIVGGIGQLLTELITQIPPIIQALLPTIVTTIQNLVKSLVNIIPTLIPVIVDLVMQLVNVIIQNLPLLIQAGIDILLGLITGITQAIPQLIPAIVEAVMLIIQTIIANLDKIIIAGIELLVALIQGLADAIPKLVAMIPQIIQTLVETLTRPDMIVKLIKAALDIIVAIAGGLIKAIPELIKAIPQIITSLVTGLAEGVGEMAKVGLDLVKGIWNGISNAVGWILGKIKEFGNSIVNGIKSFFGIKSPSRLFRDEIGANLALGVGEGFTDEMDNVVDEMQDALPSSLDTDIGLNNTGLAADALAAASSTGSTIDGLISAMQQAFAGMKVEMDDIEMGQFVVNRITEEVF